MTCPEGHALLAVVICIGGNMNWNNLKKQYPNAHDRILEFSKTTDESVSGWILVRYLESQGYTFSKTYLGIYPPFVQNLRDHEKELEARRTRK